MGSRAPQNGPTSTSADTRLEEALEHLQTYQSIEGIPQLTAWQALKVLRWISEDSQMPDLSFLDAANGQRISTKQSLIEYAHAQLPLMQGRAESKGLEEPPSEEMNAMGAAFALLASNAVSVTPRGIVIQISETVIFEVDLVGIK
ncbi:hypothetical protein HON58_03995 [Candidatus Peregrinibacteria bacterium]|jgi:hypothetical protein|nr:hypothetical protein [Candidatus Peregrinibacteria bacterium]